MGPTVITTNLCALELPDLHGFLPYLFWKFQSHCFFLGGLFFFLNILHTSSSRIKFLICFFILTGNILAADNATFRPQVMLCTACGRAWKILTMSCRVGIPLLLIHVHGSMLRVTTITVLSECKLMKKLSYIHFKVLVMFTSGLNVLPFTVTLEMHNYLVS